MSSRGWILDNSKALLTAALEGDVETAQLLLAGRAKARLVRPAQINAVDISTGYTSLHLAALHHHTELTRLLIQGGADVNACEYI